ncbi:MAG: HepT-like ribonuclease domain-containing protein [Verrucomicrobiota bacterium]
MTFNGIIERKLVSLREQVSLLCSWKLGSLVEFSNDTLRCRAVERQLQVCVEVMIDICERVLAVRQQSPVESMIITSWRWSGTAVCAPGQQRQ